MTEAELEDLAKAEAYRAQQARRDVNDRARRAGLVGDPQARAALDSRWAPLQDWLRLNDPHGDGVLR